MSAVRFPSVFGNHDLRQMWNRSWPDGSLRWAPTAFYADLWPRRMVFRLLCVLPTSLDRPHLFVRCSSRRFRNSTAYEGYCTDTTSGPAVTVPLRMLLRAVDDGHGFNPVSNQLIGFQVIEVASKVWHSCSRFFRFQAIHHD